MEHCIITIGREYGSGGHKVGEIISDRVHLPYYDNELVSLAAKWGNLNPKKLSKYDEKKHHPFFYEANYEGNEEVKRGESLSDTLFSMQRQVILEIGKKEDAVIVGRCADFILKEAGIKTLSVFIAAPFENRVRRTMEMEGLDKKTVISLTKKKDKQRKAYYEKNTGRKWGVPESYDLYFYVPEYEDLNQIADRILEKYKVLI